MIKKFLFSLIFIACSISLVRSTMGQGTDFFVYWKAGRALLDGNSIYDLNRFGGMVFKYPPWLAPLFIPIAAIPFEWAKMIWGLCCVFSLWSIFKILNFYGQVKSEILLILGLLYWGIWAIHALDGQVAIPLMALALFSVTRPVLSEESTTSGLDAMNAFALSSKLFTLFPLILLWKRYLKKGTLVLLSLFVLFGTLTVMTSTDKGAPTLFQDWKSAASSGAHYLPEGNTRGKKNPSLSNYTASLLKVPVDDAKAETLIALFYFFIAAIFLIFFTRRFDLFTRFSIALALTPLAHPLPWFHLFSWTFPLMALTAQAWWEMRNVHWRKFKRLKNDEVISAQGSINFNYYLVTLLLLLSILMIPLGTARGLGGLGAWFEDHAGKGFGTLFLIIARVMI